MAELLEPVSELQIASHDVYAKILGGQAIENIIQDNIILSSD